MVSSNHFTPPSVTFFLSQFGAQTRRQLTLGSPCVKKYFHAMRPLRALVIYIAVVFIGGALLAPWLWRLAQLFGHSFPQAAHAPFHRFLDRSFLIFALAGLWPMLRSLGATSWRDIGIVPPYGQWKKLFGGLLLGFFSLAAVAGIAIGFGGRGVVQDLAAHKVVGDDFQRHRDGGCCRHAGGNFVSRRHFRRTAPRALLAVRAFHQQRDLRARAFSPARWNSPARSSGIPGLSCSRKCWAASRISTRSCRDFSI